MWPHRLDCFAFLIVLFNYVSAMGPPVFYFTEFSMGSTTYRDQLLGRMDNISQFSCTNETGVEKYALVVPRDDDRKTMYSIEQYDDNATFQKHLAATPVAAMFAWSRNITSFFSTKPTVRNFTVIDGMNFVKPEFAKSADPYLVIEGISYKNGTASKAMPYWKDLVAIAQNENGTLAFGVYNDLQDPNKLWTLGAYASKEYIDGTHAKSAAADALEKNIKDSRTRVDQFLLQKKGGFLYKGIPCG